MTAPENIQCEHCGYSLEGLARAAERYLCPECGRQTKGHVPPGFDADRYMRINIVGTFVAPCAAMPVALVAAFAARSMAGWLALLALLIVIGYALVTPVAAAVVMVLRVAEDRRPPTAAVIAAVVPMWIANAATLILAWPVVILGLGLFYVLERL